MISTNMARHMAADMLINGIADKPADQQLRLQPIIDELVNEILLITGSVPETGYPSGKDPYDTWMERTIDGIDEPQVPES